MAELLIKHGADVNVRAVFTAFFSEDLIERTGPTPLLATIKKDSDEKIVSLLIKSGAEVAKDSLLYVRSFEVAKLLVENGADVNAKSPWGYTPLSNARTVKMAKLLIDNGADVNAISDGGDTPCDSVYSKEVRDLIKEKGGFCRNLTNLHKFVINRDKAGVKLLMEYSGLINWLLRTKKSALNARENKDGNTPLHFAKDLEIAKILIENGANINAINNKGQAAFDTIDSEEVKKYIKENGGKSGLALDKREIWSCP